MEKLLPKHKLAHFHRLKIAKKEQLSKNAFSLEFEIPENLKINFKFQAGQYVKVKYFTKFGEIIHDFSMTSAPYEEKIALAIKINSEGSSAQELFDQYNVGDFLEISEPLGRFTIPSKPHEFRTIIGFAGGIGITPIFSHFKNILHNEPRSRLFLFYSNKKSHEIIFKKELALLAKKYGERLQIFYFFSQENMGTNLFQGRIDKHKLKLIINQILHLDDTDEESTIWDSVDEVLICGKGEMIKSVANACFDNGIPKRNIHFELFETFNEDIYEQQKAFELVENIALQFSIFGRNYSTILPDNRTKILQQLLAQKFPVPFSCKSGICGSCECKLEEGTVELLENEYLTEAEVEKGHILACMSVPTSKKITLNFDLF